MEMWTEVRRRVLTGELSKRAACQEYGINWRTLGKMLAHAEPPGYRRRAKREKPILGPHLAWIHEVLEQDKKAPKKQHHTAQRIFDRLKAERDYTGGVTMVKAAVREWKDARKEVFVPLSHPPGEAQVDFGFAYVDIAGERQQVALFVMTLPYSDALSIQAFPRECTEAFLEGHNRAFRFIGGVPRKIRYDNSKIAVAKITGSRERQVTREFQRLQSHYLFDTQFCLVRRANEKGHVECLVDFGRANFLVPVPSVESLADLNETLEQRCRADLARRLRGKDGTKGERLLEERSALLPLPAQECEARRITQAGANSLSLVRFDTNSYSVPVKYAHRTITVVATVDDVKMIFEDRLIARHRRHWAGNAFSTIRSTTWRSSSGSPAPSTTPVRSPTGISQTASMCSAAGWSAPPTDSGHASSFGCSCSWRRRRSMNLRRRSITPSLRASPMSTRSASSWSIGGNRRSRFSVSTAVPT